MGAHGRNWGIGGTPKWAFVGWASQNAVLASPVRACPGPKRVLGAAPKPMDILAFFRTLKRHMVPIRKTAAVWGVSSGICADFRQREQSVAELFCI